MDGRGWPWKRKSSDKATIGQESTTVCSLSYLASLENQEKCKNTNYVQITMDSYTHMSKMEGEVNDLKEKLTIANSEIKAKECLILQHAKVAEEAVSGWEKADAETLALKRKLESVTLLKLNAEDRASHLDDALKECTRQIRIVKDESEQKLQHMILAKTTHWDKIKTELERKIDELSQGLHRGASDNAALTRSLQERSEMIVKISEEKSKAEGDVEKLKTNVKLAEKEISSLNYDVHVALKEVEIRNEEKNMSLKSAEIANKQHLEGVKKIAKLEAECQRLRGLLRKKLPGFASIAQMKLEVESLGHEFTDPRAQRSLVQPSTENVYLKRRSLEMEEEIQTLQELLSVRNNELQVSRNVCAKTLGKLKILEGQVNMFNNEKTGPKSNSESPSSGNENHYPPPSVTSVSEDGFDEEGSSSVTSIDSHKVRKLHVDGSSKLELMDDFLEIEKFAAKDPNEANSASKEDTTTLDQLLNLLRLRINSIFESQEGISIDKIVEAVRISIQEMQGSSSSRNLFEVGDETLEKHVLSSQETQKQDLEEESNNLINGQSLEMEQLKLEKESIELELSRCLQNLESTKTELTSSRDLQSMAETQLKCVTESYKSLELRSKELEDEVKRLEEESKRLEMAFSTEKCGHEETLAKCRELQVKIERNGTCKECSSSKIQPNQEKDIASATEKLAACQETIHLLSQQLQSLQPQTNHKPEEKLQQHQKLNEATTQNSALDDRILLQPSNSFRDTVKKNPTVHAIIKSSSVSSSSSKEDNEKHSTTRGLGRFFSSKVKK